MSLPGVMQPKRKADHSSTTSSGVKNGWRCTSTSSLLLCLHGTYRDNCATFFLYHTFNVYFLMGTTAMAGSPAWRSGHPTCALNELSTGDKDGQLTLIEQSDSLTSGHSGGRSMRRNFHTHGL